MSFTDNFDTASLDARWAGSSATLDDPNDRVDLSAGDLASIAGVISNAEFDELDLTFVPELTALYSSGAVYCYIVKDGSTSEIGARVHLDRQSSGGGSDRIILSWQSAQFGGWSVVQTISGQNFSSNPTIRVQRNSSGQWTISVNGSAVITNEAEPSAITNEADFNGGLTFSNTSGGYLHSVVSAGLTRYIIDIDGDDDVQAGQTGVTITAAGLDASPAVQTVTLGGEALTVTDWNGGSPIVTIPEGIDLQWGGTYTLSVTDDTDTRNLTGVTLSAPAGWDTVIFSSAPNTTDTDSFYEEAISDADLGGGGFTMAAGDVLAFETASGLTVDSQTIPTISPPATVTGAYKIYDVSAGVWTSESTYTWTDAGAPAAPADTITIDSIVPTKTGAVINWSYPGSDVDSYEYNIDGGAWIADTSPLTITGQSSSTTYTFNIRPLNQGTPGSTTSQQYTTNAASDTTPNPFSFTDVSGVALDSVNESNVITVQGVDAGQDVSVAVTDGEYRISTDGGSTFGAWTSAAGNVRLNHQVQVRGTASSSYSTAVNVTLTLDGTVSDTFTITTLADTVDPVITLVGGNVSWSQGTNWVDPGYSATDNADGSVAVTVSGSVDVNTPGTYTLTYSATDSAGNTGTTTRIVTVVADAAPTITLTGGNVTIAQGGTWSEPGYSATDAEDGDITADVVVGGDTVDTNTPGVYTITYNVSDSAGNAAAQRTRTVTVVAEANLTQLLTPENLTLDIEGEPNTTIRLFSGSANRFEVTLSVDGQTVDLSVFNRLVLKVNDTVTIDSQSDSGIDWSLGSGKIRLDIGDYLTGGGSEETIMLGYISGESSPFVLWHPELTSKLRIEKIEL